MAASSGNRKRKRRRETPEASECRRKLLLGENVEVLQLDEGLKGSWHAGVVVGLAEGSRLIEYCDMLSDDMETKLVEVISVSAALEGLLRGVSKNCRGRIRPLLQLSHARVSEITYGLCMDAFIDDAWWEGVVFDHKEGAATRLIFFPELGDQEMVAADRLRMTHDWNEVCGKWKPRGHWLFLQELQKFEQEDALPVSIREIWYDLRSMPSFIMNIGLWMVGSPQMWYALLSQLIHELWFVIHGQPTAVGTDENPLVTELMTPDATNISARDIGHQADNHSENEAATVQTVLDCQSESQCSEVPTTANCSNGSENIEVVKFCNFGTGAELPCNVHNSDPEFDSLPHPLSDYVAEYIRTGFARGSHLRPRLKRLHQNAEAYLLTIGWHFKKNKYGWKCYVSPDGATHKSLISLCEAWKNKEVHKVLYDGVSNSLSCRDTKMDTDTTLQANNTPDNVAREVGRGWQPLCLQPEFFPEAITCYASRLENKNSHCKRSEISEKVKKHLLAMGWTVEFKRGSHTRIRCFSPEGKIYYSLYKACSDLVQGYSGEFEGSNESLFHSTCSSNNRMLDSDYRCYIGHKKENASQSLSNLGNLDDNFSMHKSKKNTNSLPMSSYPDKYFSGKLLSPLFDKGIILPRQKVSYKKEGLIITEGRLTRKGIICNCCAKLYSPVTFVIHAGSNKCKHIENIVLEDGRSLLQCQMQMAQSEIPEVFSHPRLKTVYNLCQSDTICSFCRYGGKLILCDHCPSSFHPHCIGLENIPKGNWFCPSCCCNICGLSEFNNDVEHLTKQTMVFCDQCERSYHIGCKSKDGTNKLKYSPTTDGFCSKTCSMIFFRMRKLLGKSLLTSKEGLSCTVLRYTREIDAEYEQFDLETLASHQKKLNVALGLLHECFTTIIEDRTKSDVFADILFNKESELKRLNFWGFYTMLLESGDEIISVATFRVFGEKIAEMPLVCTHPHYRGQGMCRLILHELEKLLSSLGVERLCIPAVTQLLGAWTSSFGFAKMSKSERMDFLDYTFLNFQDTTMCHKLLGTAQETKMNQTGNGSTGNSETFDPNIDNHVSIIEKVEPHNVSPCLDPEAFSFPAKPNALKEIDYQSHIASSPANSSCSVASIRPEESNASIKISAPVVALCSLLNRTVDNLKLKFP